MIYVAFEKLSFAPVRKERGRDVIRWLEKGLSSVVKPYTTSEAMFHVTPTNKLCSHNE